LETAWAFYRRSTNRQELSIEDQRRECRAFADARSWQIVREFIPTKGYASGLSIERDPTFQEMVRLAETGGHSVRWLVIYDVSRFGRLVTEEKIYWEQRFKKHGGIQVAYVHGDIKNDGSLSDTLLKVVKHAEAHEYSVKLSEVTLRGAKSHSALGHSAGGAAPYGYDRLEIDPVGNPVRVMNKSNDWKSNKLHHVVWTPSPIKAPVVRWIFETYEKGTGLNLIVQKLNADKTPAPRGQYWSKTMVHYLIRNRAYMGERIYNRRSYQAYRRGEKAKLGNPQDAWIVKENAHESIVNRDLFERVQGIRRSKIVTIGRTFHRPYLLTGLARCANCGYRMIGHPAKSNGHSYLTYTCSGYLRIGKSVCRSVHVLTDALEAEVVRSIVEHLSSPEWREEVHETLDLMVKEEFGDSAQARLDELQGQLDSVTQQISNMIEAIKASGRLSEAMNRAFADLETQRDSIRATLVEVEKRANKRIGAATLAEKIMVYAGDFAKLWKDGLAIEERKELLRCYVHQINIRHAPTKVEAEIWLYKIPLPYKKITPELTDLSPLISRVNCGGRNLTLVRAIPPEILPLVTRRLAALKRPYLHYRANAA
jgi:DNA invertase Pin-like site-specific DNA recombinase